jgi:hypothetical protein
MVSETTFLHLSAPQWTAVGTIALTLVTMVYVALSGLNLRTSRRAAQAAERAAEAARDTAAAQRAGVQVDFAAECVFLGRGLAALRVENTGATIYLHGVALSLSDSDTAQLLGNHKFDAEPPRLLHRGEAQMWVLPRRTPTPAKGDASVNVTYSFEETGKPLKIGRRCSVEDLAMDESE